MLKKNDLTEKPKKIIYEGLTLTMSFLSQMYLITLNLLLAKGFLDFRSQNLINYNS